MSLLFKIDLEKKIVLANPCIRLCPVLKLLNQQQLLYIILVYDYSSKYHQFPIEERKKRGAYEAFGEGAEDPEKNKTVVRAIQEYKGLQYDPKMEFLFACNDKKAKLQQKFLFEEDYKKMNSITTAITGLLKTIKDLETEIETHHDVVELHGGGELSFLEKLQNKLQQYRQEGIRPQEPEEETTPE